MVAVPATVTVCAELPVEAPVLCPSDGSVSATTNPSTAPATPIEIRFI
jgi:hypothetical protein